MFFARREDFFDRDVGPSGPIPPRGMAHGDSRVGEYIQ